MGAGFGFVCVLNVVMMYDVYIITMMYTLMYTLYDTLYDVVMSCLCNLKAYNEN